LGCYREGAEPVGAQEEKHGVWEAVKGEVGPVLRGGSRLDPWEGQATARILRTQDPEVWCVAVKGRSLHGGGDDNAMTHLPFM